MRRSVRAVLVFLLTLCAIAIASDPQSTAQDRQVLPHLIRFHGTLFNADGSARSGVAGMLFALYTEEMGGAALWTEVKNVTVDASGNYTVLLGSEHSDGVPDDLFTTNDARWLGVQVVSEVEQPRILLVSVPYALKARDTELLGGHPASDFLMSSSLQSASSWQSTATESTSDQVQNPLTAHSIVFTPSALTAASKNFLTKSDGAGGFLQGVAYDDGTSLGIGTTTPSSKLDVQITSASPTSAINSLTTLTNGVDNPSQVVTALKLGVKDISTASNFSKQTMRLTYTRDSSATGGVAVYDTVFTATPVIDSDAPYTLIGLNMEGPNVKAGKTLANFYGAVIGAGTKGGGTISNQYALVTTPGSGNVGLNTTSPIAPLTVVADNRDGASRASQVVVQGSTNTNLRFSMGIHTEASPAYADLSFNELGVAWRNVVLAGSGGSVGIGTPTPTSRLTVNGMIESTVGGIKFPDGTVQTSATTGGGETIALSSPDSSIAIAGTSSAPTLTIGSVSLNKLGGNACSAGTLLQWSGSSWVCASLAANDASISVTSVGSTSKISVADLGITTAKLADGSVTAAKLAPGAITGDSSISVTSAGSAAKLSVADLGITTAKLADGSVTAAKLAPGAITGDASISVTSAGAAAKLSVADLGITTAKLADGSVTAAKLAPGAITASGFASLGPNSFTGDQNIRMNGPTIYALNVVNTDTSGTGGGIYAESSSGSAVAFKAHGMSLTGSAIGVYSASESTTGYGVFSAANATSGFNFGVYGQSRSNLGTGVKGESVSSSGTTYGVYGQTAGANYSTGVYGIASSTTASSIHYGVYGRAEGIYGVGVVGYAPNAALGGGNPVGVVGRTDSSRGVAANFINTAATGNILVLQNGSGNVWRVDNSGNQFMNGTVNAGGADFAEAVETIDSPQSYEPGDLLAIATSSDRKVELSTESYSTKVIGVYATKPGVLASRNGLDATGTEIPVAMIGIVPAKASAENGPIQRGDLLVSAATPGYVMKATDRQRLVGAVVGKAMQPLDSGLGVIEIAVTLQ
jgi:hypothetical protein